MLSHKTQCNLANAEEYFDEHLSTGDYYSQGDRVLGVWRGEGAKRLGLSGAIQRDAFLKLCRNLNPHSNELLTQRQKMTRKVAANDGTQMDVANRRVFYDFTFSPPKSVSIVALVGEDKRIEDAHHRAVFVALGELEQFAATRVRKHGARAQRSTGNVVAAIFRHETSRALDPHLHSHCILFNATFDEVEGRWKALENHDMLVARKYVENVYYHELARDLKQFGYEIQNRAKGDFTLKGVPQKLSDLFSKRHQQIDDATRSLLAAKPELASGNVKGIRETIAETERSRKIKDVKRLELANLWSGQISAEEKSLLNSLGKHTPVTVSEDTIDASTAIQWAEDHLFERNSVVAEHELWGNALEFARGSRVGISDIHRVTAGRGYIRNGEHPGKVTTKAVLEREWEIVCRTKSGVGQYDPFNAAYSIKRHLDAEQVRAVSHMLSSRDFITLFRGGAGTGKSFALKEVRAGLLEAGFAVQPLAPQRQQVMDLEREGFSGAQTLSGFLARRRMPVGTVLIVDEAGQIGAKQMRALISYASERGARIILSGDTRQHGPVEASDALRTIERFAGLKPAQLQRIRRQNPKLGNTGAEKRAIAEYKRAVKDAEAGAKKGNPEKLRRSFDRLDRQGAIIECTLADQQQRLTEYVLALTSRKESAVVVSQTWSEIHRVNDAVRAGLKARNLIGQQEEIVAALERLDLTDAQKRDKRHYAADSIVVFNRPAGGFKIGDWGTLYDVSSTHLFIEGNGRIRPIPFTQAAHFTVCAPKPLALASGDRLQLKANGRCQNGRILANGELVTVKKVEADGRIELDDGRVLEKTFRQFVRGYAVSSYSAQGKTADCVIFSDSAIKAATNQKQWYVTISRGRKGVRIFTADKQQLRENILRTGNRDLAIEFAGGAKGIPFNSLEQRRVSGRGLSISAAVRQYVARLISSRTSGPGQQQQRHGLCKHQATPQKTSTLNRGQRI